MKQLKIIFINSFEIDYNSGHRSNAFAVVANILVSSYLFVAKVKFNFSFADGEHLRTDVYSSPSNGRISTD
ncbi:MAG: hypothetical protein ACLSA2_06975 [Candidatus Gastranaerophilaceae bacterium]